MSWETQAWAAKAKAGDPTSKLVLIALASCADVEHLAYPSLQWLADFTELHRKTVIKCLDRLEERQLIRDTGDRKGRTGQVKVYRLEAETGQNVALLPGGQTGPKDTPFDGSNSAQSDPVAAAKEGTKVHSEPFPSGDKSPSGCARVHTCEGPAGTETVDLPAWLDAEALQAFSCQRNDRGKRLTPAGVRKLIEVLTAFRAEGLDPNERLRFSAARHKDWVFRPATNQPARMPDSSAGGNVQFRYQKPGEAPPCATFRERCHERLGKKYHCLDYARFAIDGNVLRIEASGPVIQHIQDQRLRSTIEPAVRDLLPSGGKVQFYEISPTSAARMQ